MVIAVEDEAPLVGERGMDGDEPALHLVEVAVEAAGPGVTVGEGAAFEVGGGLVVAVGERKVPAGREGGVDVDEVGAELLLREPATGGDGIGLQEQGR